MGAAAVLLVVGGLGAACGAAIQQESVQATMMTVQGSLQTGAYAALAPKCVLLDTRYKAGSPVVVAGPDGRKLQLGRLSEPYGLQVEDRYTTGLNGETVKVGTVGSCKVDFDIPDVPRGLNVYSIELDGRQWSFTEHELDNPIVLRDA